MGSGWDSHRLAAGRPLILGGVRIDSDLGLDGHSDADVLSHAITDALLGSLALGDIGVHFPDTDPKWKGSGSLVFLHHAVQLVHQAGYEVVNVDATVIIEQPKLNAHRAAICQSLASALGIGADCVSVKFKTAEGVGPVGEGKSAEAQAIATVRRAL